MAGLIGVFKWPALPLWAAGQTSTTARPCCALLHRLGAACFAGTFPMHAGILRPVGSSASSLRTMHVAVRKAVTARQGSRECSAAIVDVCTVGLASFFFQALDFLWVVVDKATRSGTRFPTVRKLPSHDAKVFDFSQVPYLVYRVTSLRIRAYDHSSSRIADR